MGEPDKYHRQKYLGIKEKDGFVVDWTFTEKCPEGDNWIWERSSCYKNGWFTLKNKNSGNLLTAPGQYNVVVKMDETNFENSLVHSWDDLRKKHCHMMRQIAIDIGEPAYKCDKETPFGACGVTSWCRLCKIYNM